MQKNLERQFTIELPILFGSSVLYFKAGDGHARVNDARKIDFVQPQDMGHYFFLNCCTF